MAEDKNGQQKFLTLRRNFLPILVSPRVDAIPKPFLLTLFVTSFLLATSAFTVYLRSLGFEENLDSSTPLPITGKAEGSCEPVLSRKDFLKNQVFPRFESVDEEFVQSTLLLLIRRPEVFDPSQLVVETEEIRQFLDFLIPVFNEFDSFGFYDFDYSNYSYNEYSYYDTVDPFVFVDTMQDFADAVSDLQFVKSAVVEDKAPLEDIVGIFDDYFDYYYYGNYTIIDEALLPSLVIEYETAEGANCVITAQPANNNIVQGILDGSCFLEQGDSDVKVFEFFYTGNENINIFVQLVSFVLNLHVGLEEGEKVSDLFVGSPFVGSVVEGESEGTLIVDDVLAVANSFCRDRPGLDVVDQFGLISGFFFALEGWFTFMFSLTLFKGRLGLEKEEVKAEKGTRKLSNVVDEKDFAEDADSLLDSDEEDDTNIIFDTELKKRMYQNKGQKSLNLVDLQRAVFNPRCRTIPHAVPVSSATFFILMTLSLMSAVAYQNFQRKEQCFSTPLNEANDDQCIDAPTINLFVFEDTGDTANFSFGSMPIEFSLQINKFADFKVEDIGVVDSLGPAVEAGCPDETRSIEGFCLDDVAEFTVLSNFTFLNETQGFLDVENFYTFDTAAGSAFLDVFFFKENRLELMGIELFLETETFNYNAFSQVQSRDVLNKDFEPNRHASTYIRTFLTETIISAEKLVAEVERTQVRCCREVSLSLVEYLGITLGYIAILEGMITLMVAVSIYSVMNLLGTW